MNKLSQELINKAVANFTKCSKSASSSQHQQTGSLEVEDWKPLTYYRRRQRSARWEMARLSWLK